MGQRFLASEKGKDMVREYEKAWGKIDISDSLRVIEGK